MTLEIPESVFNIFFGVFIEILLGKNNKRHF